MSLAEPFVPSWSGLRSGWRRAASARSSVPLLRRPPRAFPRAPRWRCRPLFSEGRCGACAGGVGEGELAVGRECSPPARTAHAVAELGLERLLVARCARAASSSHRSTSVSVACTTLIACCTFVPAVLSPSTATRSCAWWGMFVFRALAGSVPRRARAHCCRDGVVGRFDGSFAPRRQPPVPRSPRARGWPLPRSKARSRAARAWAKTRRHDTLAGRASTVAPICCRPGLSCRMASRPMGVLGLSPLSLEVDRPEGVSQDFPAFASREARHSLSRSFRKRTSRSESAAFFSICFA